MIRCLPWTAACLAAMTTIAVADDRAQVAATDPALSAPSPTVAPTAPGFTPVLAPPSAPAFALATPPAPAEPTTSYRSTTLTADAIGLALVLAGSVAEGPDGQDGGPSDVLFATGGLTMVLATPIIHGTRGHVGRAFGSFFLRWGMAAAGAMLAVKANEGCSDGMPPPQGQLFDDDFLCETEYLGVGVFAGLVAASAIDAAFMTTERTERRETWAPHLAVDRNGARVGAAFTW